MHKFKSKKYISLLLALVMALSVLFNSNITVKADDQRLQGVDYRSREEIEAFLKSQGTFKGDQYGKTVKFAENPDTSKFTKVGALAKETQEDFIKMINSVRYIAGLDYNVTWDDSYAYLTQAASLVNNANNSLTHTPSRPAGCPEDVYQDGYRGASSSNIAMGYSNVWSALVGGWMHDGDNSNIDRCGHRRWVLNPNMGKTAIGFVNRYSAMYAFDSSNSGGQYGVAWPAQNMPVEYFGNTYPWTYSSGTTQPSSGITVTLKEKSSGKTWTFSQKGNSSVGYFNVENTRYGAPGCVIFRPADIKIANGQSYDVSINGLTEGTVNYTVNFFGAQEYTVKFDTQGGEAISDSKVTPGDSVILPTPKKSGYIFDGWYTSASGGDKIFYAYTPAGNTTLYAHWSQVSVSGLTVSYTGPTSLPEGSVIEKSSLIVTAKHSDGTTMTVSDYTLTGNTIVTGKNTVTVSYGGKTASFTITGTAVNKTKQAAAIDAAKAVRNKGYSIRLYNPSTGDHVYTADIAEAEDLIKKGWDHETQSSGKNSYKSSLTKTDEYNRAVYCVYNPNDGGNHVYTYSSGEARYLASLGWIGFNGGKPIYYVSKNSTGKKGIYRAYNPNSSNGQQHYCTKSEYKYLLSIGWEGNNSDKPYWYTN